MKKLGIYIHIPFCVRKCKYCDFLSFDSLKEDVKGRYVNALFSEIKMQGKRFQGYEADTIFIGGGTPTVVQAEYIAEIVECVKENFHLAEAAEITIEANPGTVTPEMLEIYRKSGVNRLSIGVQSLDDKVLSALGRIHTAEEFRNTYFAARHAGFNNINIDLMIAVPLQTEEIWEKTLKEAIRLKPEHISFYSLQREEGTEFYRMYKEGRLTLADDDTDRRMYHTAVKMLKEAGYHHYEISNAAKPGFESRHNMKYWQFDEYIGLGLGAVQGVLGLGQSVAQGNGIITQGTQLGLVQAVDNTVHAVNTGAGQIAVHFGAGSTQVLYVIGSEHTGSKDASHDNADQHRNELLELVHDFCPPFFKGASLRRQLCAYKAQLKNSPL